MHIFANPVTIIDWSVIEFVCIRVIQIIANEYGFNPLTRKGQYTGHFTKCTENAKASILAATTRNQTNSHSFNLARLRIKVFIYYYSPLNSV